MRPELELIQGLEEQLLEKATRSSPEALGMLLADHFIEFGRSGGVYRKADVIKALAAERDHDSESRRAASDFELTFLSDGVVLLTYRSVRCLPGSTQKQHSLRSSIWQFIDDRWQMVFHQGTPVRS